ncbi:IS66 family transposase [Streptomyces sp. NPDC051162]|uniref:IS66 family transposase n=1 Tax=Streptomyces sp. NPDC051162 TaxID=3154747 RepID=UPI0034362ABB
MSDLASLSREELVALARRQDAQITVMAAQLAALMEKFEQQEAELTRLRHLVSRNSGNSSMPPSKDDDPGRTPPRKQRRAKPSGRGKGKQPGAPGTALRWRGEDELDHHEQRFPEGPCVCGVDLATAHDLGVVDRYQQHEIPLVSVTVTQYDQHAVACSCGKVHTAARPDGAGGGRVEYGPNLRAYAVYLLVVHFVPVHRVAEILTSLTGAEPSAGFVHSPLRRAARALHACDFAIRTLITLAFAVCADETPLKVGPATPAEGKKEAKGYLHVACTDLYTHFLLGDRSMKTFRQTVLADLEPGAVTVHDRYHTYDSTQLGDLDHQLCLAHVLRDLAGAAELYPDDTWPVQLADELRELIHRANQARTRGEATLPQRVKDLGMRGLRAAVRIGLAATKRIDDTRPGARKTRLLLEAFRDREDDFLRFTTDLRIPPTSNQAERDLRPSKIQENISGRLTDPDRAKDRYLIRGVLSTAVKHAVNPLTVLRGAFTGTTWLPPAARA